MATVRSSLPPPPRRSMNPCTERNPLRRALLIGCCATLTHTDSCRNIFFPMAATSVRHRRCLGAVQSSPPRSFSGVNPKPLPPPPKIPPPGNPSTTACELHSRRGSNLLFQNRPESCAPLHSRERISLPHRAAAAERASP